MAASGIANLNAEFGLAGRVLFAIGPGGLPVARLTAPGGTAEVCLLGGQVLSYEPVGWGPVLWLSRCSEFRVGHPIRGGIPVCWPWFGAHPTDPALPMHGFARLVQWQPHNAVFDQDRGVVELILRLTDGDGTRALWPQAFEAHVVVTVAERLSVDLHVKNCGAGGFDCTAALHSYFVVSDIRQAAVHGLDGCAYVDTVGEHRHGMQRGPLRFTGETDRVYLDTAAACVIEDPGGGRCLRVAKRGSRSTVVWNPWEAKAARLPDFGDDEYSGMLCVETTKALTDRVTLVPGETHCLGTTISVERVQSQT